MPAGVKAHACNYIDLQPRAAQKRRQACDDLIDNATTDASIARYEAAVDDLADMRGGASVAVEQAAHLRRRLFGHAVDFSDLDEEAVRDLRLLDAILANLKYASM